MAGVNKIILVGNLGKDPEIRHLDTGRAVVKFPLATSETYKNKAGEKVTNTEWHNVIFWSPIAEIVEKYLEKGSKVYVEGKLTNRFYDDKDGNKRYVTEIVGRDMVMLGKGQAMNQLEEDPGFYEPAPKPTTTASENKEPSLGGEDELPF